MGLTRQHKHTRALPTPERSGPTGQAGDKLAVEAIDRTGLIVTGEGALVRIIEVTPPNPLILSNDDRVRVAEALSQLVSRLRAHQTLQFYVESRPINLDQVLADCRAQVQAWAGPVPTRDAPASSELGLSRWRLYGGMEESLRRHADDQAAVQTSAYVVVPYTPAEKTAKALLALFRHALGSSRVMQGSLERGLKAHRRAVRESLAHTDAIRSELDALSLPTRLLNGEQVVSLLWGRFNPTSQDRGRHAPAAGVEVLGELDAPVDALEARQVALKLRELIARSPLDFGRSKHYAEIEHDVEQTIYAATTAETTYYGWLMGAMLTRQPFTLSVFVHALDRARERQRLKLGYRRVFTINRGAEARGRVPDPDRYAQEAELSAVLAQMTSSDRASIYQVSIYLSIRARGPAPDPAALTEAVDYCKESLESCSDVKVHRGEFQQDVLWETTLPLGRDVAGRDRKYVTRNVGDCVPLIGTACGSPAGIPFAFSDPGRTLELLDPYDRAHANHTLLIAGRSGSGKTMAANVILSRCLAHGARGFVLDRAGHYSLLTRLVAGAQQIDIGAEQSRYAINPWDVSDKCNPPREKISFLVSLHGVMMGDEGLSVLERSQLGAAIRGVYARAATLGETPRESMLRAELRNRADVELEAGSVEIASVLRSLAERLGEFCDEGSYAYLLDRETTVGEDAPLVVFDTRRCPEVVLKPVMFSIIEYVTRTIERHRDDHAKLASQPDAPMFAGKSVLLIDEGWHLVGRRETGEYANDLARRARHLGLFLVVMSQHMSDFNSEHGLALIRNSTMQLFLAQHPDEIPYVQEALRLSDQEAAILGRLKTVKGSHSQAFWINGTRGKGRVAIRVGPTEYWAFTSDPIRDVPARDAKIADCDGDVWRAIHTLATTDTHADAAT